MGITQPGFLSVNFSASKSTLSILIVYKVSCMMIMEVDT
jgi:hypothetical protein